MVGIFVLLVAYGNAKSLFLPSAVPEQPWPALALGIGLSLVVLAATRVGPVLSSSDLGLARGGSGHAALIGSVFGLLAALSALAILRFPPLLGEPVRYAPLADAPVGALLLRALVFMPLDTAIPEELAFRGALFGWLRRERGIAAATLVSAAAFTAWHIVIVFATLLETNVIQSPLTATLGTLGAFGALFGAGLAFALLRARTGRLAAPLLAHATFNAVLLLGLGL